MPYTRHDDDPDVAARIHAARRDGRKYTIIYSCLLAGFISLFFAWGNDRDQRDRSIRNCNLIQQDRRDSAHEFRKQAENVLGNSAKGIKPFKLTGTAFEKFAPIIRAQATENLARAKTIESRIENCEDVFPTPKVIPFIA